MKKGRSRPIFKFKLITCLVRGRYAMPSGNIAQTPDFLRFKLSGFVQLGRKKTKIYISEKKERYSLTKVTLQMIFHFGRERK
jgi:hypothetical protein